jgi:hypothetical protein
MSNSARQLEISALIQTFTPHHEKSRDFAPAIDLVESNFVNHLTSLPTLGSMTVCHFLK